MSQENRAELLAAALGVPQDALREIPNQMQDAMRNGVIVTLHVGRWRGWTTLTPEDLGLPKTKEYRDWVSFGSKRLMDAKLMKEIEAVEYNARYWLARYATQTYWGWFVGARAWTALKPILEERKEKYFALRDALLAVYETKVEEVLAHYAEIGRVAYRRANKLPGDYDFDWRVDFEDVAVDRFVAKIAQRIPSKGELAASFSFDWDMHFIPLTLDVPDNVDKESLEVAALRREVIEKMRSEQDALVKDFFADYKGQLAALVYDSVVLLGDTTTRAGKLQPRSVRQIWELTERMAAMNITADEEIDQYIARLREIAGTPSRLRSMDDVLRQFRDIATVTRAQLVALGRAPREAGDRKEFTAAAISVDTVRSSRKRLGLQLDTADQQAPTRRNRRSL